MLVRIRRYTRLLFILEEKIIPQILILLVVSKYHIPFELGILNSHDQLFTRKNGVALPLPRKKCHEISLNVSFLSSFKQEFVKLYLEYLCHYLPFFTKIVLQVIILKQILSFSQPMTKCLEIRRKNDIIVDHLCELDKNSILKVQIKCSV